MPLWNPQSVLDLYHSPASTTCSGTTKKGLRCKQSMIPNADRAKSTNIMLVMSHEEPHSIRPELYDQLAYLTLCPRWHRKPGYSQVYDVAQRFRRSVEMHFSLRARATPDHLAGTTLPHITSNIQQIPNRRVELIEDLPLPPRRQQRLLPPSPAESCRSSTVPASHSPPSPNTSSRSDRPSQVQGHPRHTLLQVPQIEQDTPPSSASSSRRSSIASVPTVPYPTPPTPAQRRDRVQTPPATPPPPSPSSTSPSTPTSPPSNPRSLIRERPLPPTPAQPPTASHRVSSSPCPTPRKSTYEACCICYEPLTLDTSVYCRRQCGTNVHRDCFKTWRLQCLSQWDARHRPARNAGDVEFESREKRRDAAVTCVYCRSQWMWEWED